MKSNIGFKNKTFYVKYLFILLALCLLGCEDVVEVDLATGESKVVIDAEILWQKGTDGKTQTIKISRSTAYYNPTVPKVSGAEVHIENSNGDVFVFEESETQGIYVCTNFVPELYKTYTLYVKVEDQTYTASETLTPVSGINRVEQKLIDDFSGKNIEVSFFYDDPEDEMNYYLINFTTDILPYPDYELTDDEFYNGNEIKNDFSDEDLKPGTIIDINLRGVSKQFYNYMNLILESTSSNPFSTPPANIKGNIVNQNSQGTSALGYFRLCESDHITYQVK